MAESGLLFIPDISGFTKFINENEIEHSRVIIEQLLENIINSNKIGLQISEVEGDAILFYRFGNNPSFEEISNQVEGMFCNFQKQIRNYEEARLCTCSACKSAVNLSLKIITHYGEFSSYNVKDFSKLIGKDVIVAHQLLKNDIDLHEYWLATDNLFAGEVHNGLLPEWLQWQRGNKQTENGEIEYDYSMLTSLKEHIQPDPLPDRTLGNKKIKIAAAEKILDADIISVLSIMGNLPIRHKWQAGVKQVDKINHPIYHLGTRFQSATDEGTIVYYSSSFEQTGDIMRLSETDEKKTRSIYVTLKPVSENKTATMLEVYIPARPLAKFFAPLFAKKRVEKNLKQSLDGLQQLIKDEPGLLIPM